MSINFEDYKNKKGAYDDVAARRFQLQMLDDGEEHPEDNVDTTFSKEYDEQQFDRMMEINSKPGLRKKREHDECSFARFVRRRRWRPRYRFVD